MYEDRLGEFTLQTSTFRLHNEFIESILFMLM